MTDLTFLYYEKIFYVYNCFLVLHWWLLLRWLPLRWLLLGWMLRRWLFLGWLLLTFSLNKTPLGETGCLGNLYFLLTGCLGIQFDSPPFSQCSQLGCLWLPSPHCTALVWLTRHHSICHQLLPTQNLLRETGYY